MIWIGLAPHLANEDFSATPKLISASWILALFPFFGIAADPTQKDIEFATVGEHSLKLDLYLPEAKPLRKPKLIVWVHGGAWRKGSKENMPLTGLTKEGFAVASISYRLSPVAKFPAQVHDIKAALRFLRRAH